jgi:hypothetical protein
LYVDARHKGDSVAVPLLIHDPLHDLPRRVEVLAGTRDLAPTLAHLLGLREAANSMTGMSIFGLRPQFPFLVGRVGERLAFAHSRDTHVELPIGVLQARCRAGEVLVRVHDIDWTACDLQRWLAWQDDLWRAKRLFPSTLYHGADGVERKALERRQEAVLPPLPLTATAPH